MAKRTAKKVHIAWGLFNFNRLMTVGHTRKYVIERVLGSMDEYRRAKRKGYMRCVKVEVREIKSPR